MPRIELAPKVEQDLDRILDHLERYAVVDARDRIAAIIAAIDVLATNPLIGRPAGNHKRELIIGTASHGYVALYRYLPALDIVLILALRAQREAGYGQR